VVGSGTSSAAGGCGNAPTFSLQITFQPLPTTSAAAAAAKTRTVADSSTGAAK
jgi:hypothetical protein